MRLLYFYAECLSELRGIGETSFNFSRTNRFAFDRNRNCICIEPLEKPIPEYFFDEENQIYNTNFFVGDNGSGKTTILHEMIRNLEKAAECEEKDKPKRILMIIESESYPDQYIVLDLEGHTLLTEKLQIGDIYCTKMKEMPWEDFRKLLRKTVVMYNSNLFQANDRHLDPFCRNASIAASVSRWKDEMHSEMNFLLNVDSTDLVKKLNQAGCPAPIPRSITLLFYKEMEWYEIPENISDWLLQQSVSERPKHDGYSENQTYIQQPDSGTNYEKMKFDKDSVTVQLFCKEMRNPVMRQWLENYGAVIGNVTRIIVPMESVYQDKERFQYLSVLYRCVRLLGLDQVLDFTWGMSSGEENLLRMMANEYEVAEASKYMIQSGKLQELTEASEEKPTIFYFWDEIDNGFHPEWQRMLLKTWIHTAKYIFNSHDFGEIQLFATTHSPLVLSDVPGTGIVYLQKEKQKRITMHPDTFGENLYGILRDGFYLQHGALGDLAQEKIAGILKACQLFNKALNEKTSQKAYSSVEEITFPAEKQSPAENQFSKENVSRGEIAFLLQMENRYRRIAGKPQVIWRREQCDFRELVVNEDWVYLSVLTEEANLFSGIFRTKLLQELHRVEEQKENLYRKEHRKEFLQQKLKQLQEELDSMS